jgi:lipoprotein signal peptidase
VALLDVGDHRSGERPSQQLLPGYFDIAVATFRPHSAVGDDMFQGLRTLGGCELWPHVNEGALFGIGQGKNLIFGAVSVLAALFILGWSTREAASRDWFLCVALGLILAGTLGNLYDRVVFAGVRDFFHWYKWYDWPVFNVADICLVTGAGMLLLEAFFRQPNELAPVSGAKLQDVS